MQITRVEVTPVDLKLREPIRMAGFREVLSITAVFVRLETQKGQSAWGCTVAHPDLTGEKPGDTIAACRECARLVPDLNPTTIEFSLGELAAYKKMTPSVMCAFDLAFHDLLSIAAGMPLYRILGGYRSRLQTSVTIPIATVAESVQMALRWASMGFRMLKIKGGLDAAEDVRRVQAIHTALPDLSLRLDADGGYSVDQALDVTRAVGDIVELLEQPTPAGDLTGLGQVRAVSNVPIIADQSLRGPESALELASRHIVDGMSIKLATCGGLRCARQIDAIARAARVATMVGSMVEPALLTSAGLSLALSSPNVRYGDLDGYLYLVEDPSRVGFVLEDGWLMASEAPGLGFTVDL
jgi:L-alanine-DL-glutamate epimerase-like enolase superfamily enzyme